jgi:DNA repair exonuclease SbcCD ATPase subunit
MRLHRLSLRNFKGVRSFDLEPDGASTDVFGSNAAGKSTLADAFMWLLFGKDSHNQANFEIKTLDENGEARHGLDHAVEAELDLDGDRVTLRKVYKEKWSKPRGSAKDVFTGHTTEHYLDDVPVQKKEYDARISEIADEGTFRLLTDPTYFNQVLHWQDRRRILLEVCGDVSDADVVSQHADLVDLAGILGKHSIDEYRKIATARRKKANEELDRIPVRIDEVERSKPAFDGSADRGELEASLEALRSKRGELEEQRAQASATTAVAEKQAELREVEEARRQVERRVKAAAEEAADQAMRDARVAAAKADEQEVAAKAIERDRLAAAGEIERLEKRVTDLRTEWNRVHERTLDHHEAQSCPACGQALPADQVEAAHRRAYEEFNAKKARDLQTIQENGKAARARVDELEAQEARLSERLEAAEEVAETLREKAKSLLARANELAAAVPDPSEDPEHQKLTARIEALQAEIDELRAGTRDAAVEIDERIAEVDAEITRAQAQLAALDQIQKADARIKELSDEERRLATEIEELERHLHLIDEFTRAKVRALEARINEHFELVRFKLFDDQVNGGLTETCVTTVDGVPYDSLNGGARVNAGLDIIRTLQAHYDFMPPVFVDNAESVVNLLDTRGQMIRLVVSPTDPKLRVETHQEVAA